MKNTILTLSLLLTMTLTLMAQIGEKEIRMSEGINNAMTVELTGANKKLAEKEWKDFSKKLGKLERDKKNDEYFILDAIVPSIDPEYAVNIYTKFDEYDNTTRAYFWFKMDEHFLNSEDDAKEVEGAEVFLTDYAIEVEKEVILDELKDEEDELKDLEKDLSKLEKQNKNLHKDIEKARETIRKAEEAIEKNEREQEDKKDEINAQKEIVKSVSDKMNKVGKTR